MIELLDAIQNAFNANPNLTGMFPNGLEALEAFDTEKLPTCLFFPVTGIPEYNTGQNIVENDCIQFSVYSDDGTIALTALDQIRKTYDHKPLPMPNDILLDARVIGLNRIIKEDERVFRADIEFQFKVGKSL